MKQKIVLVFSMLVLGFGGYMVYEQLVQEKPEKEINESQREEKLKSSDENTSKTGRGKPNI